MTRNNLAIPEGATVKIKGINYVLWLRKGISVKIQDTIFMGTTWREIIGEKWNFNLLMPYLKDLENGDEIEKAIIEQWPLVARSMLNYGDSREKLAPILNNLFYNVSVIKETEVLKHKVSTDLDRN